MKYYIEFYDDDLGWERDEEPFESEEEAEEEATKFCAEWRVVSVKKA